MIETARIKLPKSSDSQRHAVDVLIDGKLLNGKRLVEDAIAFGVKFIEARVWESEDQYCKFYEMEADARKRQLS